MIAKYQAAQPDTAVMSVGDFLTSDESVQTRSAPTAEEIIASVKPAEVDQDHSSDDEEIPPPTLAEVRKAINTLTRFVD